VSLPDLPGWVAAHQDIVLRTMGEHIVLSVTALAVVLAIALPLGIVLSRRSEGSAASIIAIVNTLRTIPSLALLVIMLPLLGTGFLPSVVALSLYGLPAVLLNTTIGLREVDRDVVDAARGQGMAETQILRGVTIPLALPVILAGIRTASVQIVSAATLAVFIGGGGLGELISSGLGLMDMAQLTTGALLVTGLAVLTEAGLGLTQRALARRYGAAA
jgi:osmoprotectant transport system permease protein